MAGSLVIAAIPEAQDRVWKVSSEKVPHLTILYLGDADNVAPETVKRIWEFVWHAVRVNEHGPFMLDVERRDILGEDKADVLHFEKDWGLKWVSELRNQLLKNNDIRSAYESVEQFPEWMPHLTLGYPETPAKDKEDDDPLRWVSFDRIAVWTGNYEGPEFRLKWSDRDQLELAMSDISKTGEEAVEELLHFGVKGMKWGVRNKAGKAGRAIKRGAKAAGLALGDHLWEQDAYSTSGQVRVHNAMAGHFNKNIKAINSKPKYDVDLNDRKNSKVKEAYDNEIKKLTHESYEKATKDVLGSSPSGKKVAVYDRKSGLIEIREKGGKDTRGVERTPFFEENPAVPTVVKTRGSSTVARHAADDEEVDITVKVRFDPLGKVIQVNYAKLAEESLEQTALLGQAFLAHYGIKGMKWGVRNEHSISSLRKERRDRIEAERRAKRAPKEVDAHDTIGRTSLSKTQIKTKGGQDIPAADDAIKVAVVQQKLKRSGPAALSNKELKEVAERLQLESNVNRLQKETSNSGRGFVCGLLSRKAKSQADRQTEKLFNLAGDRAFDAAQRKAVKIP